MLRRLPSRLLGSTNARPCVQKSGHRRAKAESREGERGRERDREREREREREQRKIFGQHGRGIRAEGRSNWRDVPATQHERRKEDDKGKGLRGTWLGWGRPGRRQAKKKRALQCPERTLPLPVWDAGAPPPALSWIDRSIAWFPSRLERTARLDSSVPAISLYPSVGTPGLACGVRSASRMGHGSSLREIDFLLSPASSGPACKCPFQHPVPHLA